MHSNEVAGQSREAEVVQWWDEVLFRLHNKANWPPILQLPYKDKVKLVQAAEEVFLP
jgi:hypothetical protein